MYNKDNIKRASTPRLIGSVWMPLKEVGSDFFFTTSLLEQLAKTNQVQYLQSIKVKQIIQNDNVVKNMHELIRFIVLKELEVYFYSYPPSSITGSLYIISLMNLLSRIKLETLALLNVKLVIDKSIAPLAYSSLKSLSLVNAVFTENTDIVLCQTFSNLRCLKLNDCSFHENMLIFPDLDLSYLEITKLSKQKKAYSLLLTTIDNNQQHLYTTSQNDYYIDSYIPGVQENLLDSQYTSSKPYERSTDDPDLTVESAP